MNIDTLSNIVNELTGLGTEYDSLNTLNIRQGYNPLLRDRVYLGSLYRNSWACKKVVEYKPIMMSRAWGEVHCDKTPQLADTLKPHLDNLKKIYRQGQIVANLYGGASVIRVVDDGQPMSEPINWDRVKKIKYSRIFDKWELHPYFPDNEWDFYEPTLYEFIGGTSGNNFTTVEHIHKDRVLRFRGKFLPPESYQENEHWEASILEDFIEPYFRFTSGIGYVGDALRNFEVMIFLVEGLFEAIAEGDATGSQDYKNRMKILQQQVSSMRGVTLDKATEDIKFIERKFNNIHNILEQLRQEMIASSGLTKPQFYQEHPSGLAATGESERLAEANDLLATQEEKWGDLIRQDLRLIINSLGFKNSKWNWNWKSLYATTPNEDIDIRLKIANMDKINIELGIYTAEEVRASRFEGVEYSKELTLNSNIRKDAVEKFLPDGYVIPISDYPDTDINDLMSLIEE